MSAISGLENSHRQASSPSLELSGSVEKLKYWIYKHPTTLKIIEMAALILTTASLDVLPFVVTSWSMAGLITLGIAGSLTTITAMVCLVVLDVFVPPHHDMKNHVYKPSSCEGGRLYYEGDIPLLSLDSDNPRLGG